MRVLAFTRYDRLGASSRMRVFQYIPVLRALGIEVRVSPLLNDKYLERLYAGRRTKWATIAVYYLMRTVRLLTVGTFDLLWIEKELFPNLPAWFEQVLNALRIPYIVDYDDAIFHQYDLSHKFLTRLLMANKIDGVMRNATMVVCGNAYLAERAFSAGAACVTIIPTVLDINRYAVSQPLAKKYIIIGWIGSPSTVRYLEIVAPVLKSLLEEYPVRLRVIGAEFVLPGFDVECLPWSEESEVSQIQDIDIGIMPLLDSPWERGKCGYKLIQYMACSKPVIASAVGVNKEIVKHGINGYLANGSREWLTAFLALCANPETRLLMGEQGRISVERSYCLQAVVPQLARLLRETAGQEIR